MYSRTPELIRQLRVCANLLTTKEGYPPEQVMTPDFVPATIMDALAHIQEALGKNNFALMLALIQDKTKVDYRLPNKLDELPYTSLETACQQLIVVLAQVQALQTLAEHQDQWTTTDTIPLLVKAIGNQLLANHLVVMASKSETPAVSNQ